MPLTDSPPDALARVYAQSLFELAQQQGGQAVIESTLGELEDIMDLARADPAFSEFLSSRILPAADRAKSLANIFKSRASDLTLNFLRTLNDKGRLNHLPAIAAAYDQIVQNAFGRIEVDVYTASPISAEELNVIRDRLKRALGKDPIVHPYTDNSMIGGLKLQIGDQLIDASVATSLRKLRDRLALDGSEKVRARASSIIDSAEGTTNGRKPAL
jgi:F-type H+-transporting ATPase subunit delta